MNVEFPKQKFWPRGDMIITYFHLRIVGCWIIVVFHSNRSLLFGGHILHYLTFPWLCYVCRSKISM